MLIIRSKTSLHFTDRLIPKVEKMTGNDRSEESNEMTSVVASDDIQHILYDSKSDVENVAKIESVKRTNAANSNESNRAMDRVQSALKAQLLRSRDRIQRQYRDEQDEFRKAKKEREDCGVELYGIQQQLAHLQKKLDDTSNQHAGLTNDRNDVENKLVETRTQVEKRRSTKDELKIKSSKRKGQLDEADSALKQAQKFNQETQNEVAVTKRAASKADEVVKGSEKGKEAQDIYIDGLNEQIKQLETDIELAGNQLKIQKSQTKEAETIIEEMTIQVEVLSSEKKGLVQQWNSAILALGRRDQGLAAAARAVKNAQDASKDQDAEMIGLRREAFNLSLEKEKMIFGRNKLESELKFIEEVIKRDKAGQESLASQIEMVSKIITNTQEEETQGEREVKKNVSDAITLTNRIEAISRERRELEEQ